MLIYCSGVCAVALRLCSFIKNNPSEQVSTQRLLSSVSHGVALNESRVLQKYFFAIYVTGTLCWNSGLISQPCFVLA